MRSTVLAIVFMAFALAGCAKTPPPLSVGPLAVLPMKELPPPSSGSAQAYRVGGLDTFVVDVYGVEGLSNREIRSDAAGRISVPLAGSIAASGMTLEELAREIERRLDRYVVRPQVTVNVKDIVSQQITVDGQVREPGLYPVVGEMTLMRAVARAKGVVETAKLEEVVVFRTVGDQKLAALYNLAAIRAGRYEDPRIYANDIVIIGDSPARRFFRDFLTLSSLLTTPLVILLQQL